MGQPNEHPPWLSDTVGGEQKRSLVVFTDEQGQSKWVVLSIV